MVLSCSDDALCTLIFVVDLSRSTLGYFRIQFAICTSLVLTVHLPSPSQIKMHAPPPTLPLSQSHICPLPKGGIKVHGQAASQKAASVDLTSGLFPPVFKWNPRNAFKELQQNKINCSIWPRKHKTSMDSLCTHTYAHTLTCRMLIYKYS